MDTLKLPDRAKDVEDKLAGRRRGVDAHRQDAQRDALLGQPLDDANQVGDTARQSIQLGHDDGVALSGEVERLGDRPCG